LGCGVTRLRGIDGVHSQSPQPRNHANLFFVKTAPMDHSASLHGSSFQERCLPDSWAIFGINSRRHRTISFFAACPPRVWHGLETSLQTGGFWGARSLHLLTASAKVTPCCHAVQATGVGTASRLDECHVTAWPRGSHDWATYSPLRFRHALSHHKIPGLRVERRGSGCRGITASATATSATKRASCRKNKTLRTDPE